MLAHGVAELRALAAACATQDLGTVNGWAVDLWEMTADDVDLAVETYQAVVAADTDPGDAISQLLGSQGIDLNRLLAGASDGRELITRSDISEFAAAAAMIAIEDCDTDRMHMPNIPKMARRKSDSGVDIADILLDYEMAPNDILGTQERLTLSSVKHSLSGTTQRVRASLAASLASGELSTPYVTQQLRVICGRLIQEGIPQELANRVFLFLTAFPSPASVKLVGTAVIEPSRRADAESNLSLLPVVETQSRFRLVLFPNLDRVHLRCP